MLPMVVGDRGREHTVAIGALEHLDFEDRQNMMSHELKRRQKIKQ
jgi:hypothetical protein